MDQLLSEVGSGGFEAYLYYCGMYFERAEKAAVEMQMEKLVALMNRVKEVFPKTRIPKNIERIQEIMDDNELSFEVCDEEFYEAVESEICEKVAQYVAGNKGKLR